VSEAALLALLLASLRLATPLAIAALGELVAERAGVLNIGIEGMMLGGAFAAYLAACLSGSPWLGVCAGALAGVLLAALFGAFVLGRGADPIVCGTALNILALGATGSAYRAAFAPAEVASAPPLGNLVPGLHAFVFIALLAAVGIGLFLARTRLGLAIRASGESPAAAHAQGVSVVGLRWACTLFGGGLAGVAGSALVLWISDSFVEGMTSGRGFIALALVLFGAYRPARIVAGALLFGAASALQFRLQALGVEISYNLLLMLPYVLTLAVLAVSAGRVRPPAGLGRDFVARR